MDERAVRILVDAVEVNEEGEAKYSGKENIKKHDILMPDLVEGIDIDHTTLRISEKRLQSDIDNALVAVQNSDDVISSFESELENVEDRIRETDVSRYIIAFPLNFDSRSADLLPDQIEIDSISFQRIEKSDWKSQFVPDFDQGQEKDEVEIGSPEHQRSKLERFLEKSPNELTPTWGTFWRATYYARDPKFAIDAVADSLSVLLGQMNYALQYNKSQGISVRSGPWPARWSDLRQPFVYLLYDDGQNFHSYYYDEVDASPRELESPHSMYEEVFREVFQSTPDFSEEYPLDGHLKKAFRAYQSGLSNPSQREAFFELWRAMEILSLKEDAESTSSAVNRARVLFDWKNPELADIQESKAVQKRNEHVHDGQNSEVTVRDKNFVKQLVDGLLDHYMDRRKEWGPSQMRFSLKQFTVDENSINNMKRHREKEIKVLDWMEEIAEQNT